MSKGHLSAPFTWVKRQISQIPANNNILINSNFKNPVNQRDVEDSALVTNKTKRYTIDRWRQNYKTDDESKSGGSFSITENGIKLEAPAGIIQNVLEQYLEFPSVYKNKYLTLSVKYRATGKASIYAAESRNGWAEVKIPINIDMICDGEWHIASSTGLFTIAESALYTGIGNIVIEDNSVLPLDVDSSIEVEWIKLEEGTQPTPYVPRSYGEELQLCQRFYQIIRKHVIPSNYYTDNHLGALVHYSGMRVKPSTTFLSGTNVAKYAYNSAVSQTGFDFTIKTNSGFSCDVYATKTAHGLTPTTALINVHMGLDAEL